MSSFKFIDLFCGLWWFRIALEDLWWSCVFSSDIDEKVQETYYNNFWERPHWDITKIDPKIIPDHDILCWWFPCQPFSVAGKRLWFEDARWTLFFYVAEIIKEKKPKWFILENVKWLVNHDWGNTLKTIIRILDDLWYRVFYKVLNARNFGIPQNRERIIITWFQKDIKPSFQFPINSIESTVELEEIINLENREINISNICKTNIETHIINNQNALRLLDRWKIVFAYEIRRSKCSFKWGNESPCLTAKMWTGGNNVPVIVGLNRKITVEEGLKLMGFPDGYKIENSFHGYKQIWNSVVIPMIKEVAKNVIKHIVD